MNKKCSALSILMCISLCFITSGCGWNTSFLVDVLPIAKARGFWDTDEPCYQMTVLRVLSAMDNALPIFIV